MTRAVALALCVVWAMPLFGASPDPDDLAIPQQEIERARDLIRRLGSEIYREREAAQADLAKMGRLARPALLEAASADPDPEVRFRCSRLLPKAGAEDLKARLDTFLADTEGKYEHNLPGLTHYRKIAGSDKASRDLFVEIIKSPHNLELLQMLEKTSAEGGRAISDRRMAMWNLVQQRMINGRFHPGQQLPLPDIACLVFAETVVPSKDIPRNNMWNHVSGVTFVGQQQSSLDALGISGKPHADVYKRIVSQWLTSRDDAMDLTNLAFQAGNLRHLKETVPLLRRIVLTDGVQGYAKGMALSQLYQIRGKDEVDLLKSLLSNDMVAYVIFFGNVAGGVNVNVQHQCLIRDEALAMLIALSGQRIVDYGFQFAPGGGQDGVHLGYGNYAFVTEEARNAAMVKFGFWRMKQAGKEPASTSPMSTTPTPPVEKK